MLGEKWAHNIHYVPGTVLSREDTAMKRQGPWPLLGSSYSSRETEDEEAKNKYYN